MTNPAPICDYEGSDYQSSFWENGDRRYEDAVEEVALRRLLPKTGKMLLELGAGAGRNTSRYTGYERIILLDYSRTQLEQARQRLGESERYTYIAADIYHLPFIDGLFDGATMIRTLHHMAEARAALAQVRRVLQPNAIFILEFANKQNLKAILRYATRRQTWSPFSPEPVEFAPLNFDFHPATVRSWLRSCQFSIERQLTVSHYRMQFFKRFFPLGLLVTLDSLAQLSGDAWQLSPSVFVRARAVAPAFQGVTPASQGVTPASQGVTPAPQEDDRASISIFRCPACGQAPLADTPPEIVCPACGQRYSFSDGIYDFRLK